MTREEYNLITDIEKSTDIANDLMVDELALLIYLNKSIADQQIFTYRDLMDIAVRSYALGKTRGK